MQGEAVPRDKATGRQGIVTHPHIQALQKAMCFFFPRPSPRSPTGLFVWELGGVSAGLSALRGVGRPAAGGHRCRRGEKEEAACRHVQYFPDEEQTHDPDRWVTRLHHMPRLLDPPTDPGQPGGHPPHLLSPRCCSPHLTDGCCAVPLPWPRCPTRPEHSVDFRLPRCNRNA